MGKHKLTANVLSLNSLRKLQNDLEHYRDSLEYKCQLIVEKLAERGVEIARVQIADMDAIYKGELIESVHAEYRGSVKGGAVWAVVADSDHAAFVEFGTGFVGKDSPYKGELPEGVTWEYGSGTKIREYVINGQTVVGWFYPDADGTMHFTEGMPSRPFMTMTAEELRKIVEDVAREVFK